MKNILILILPLLFAGCLSPKPSNQPAFYQLQEAKEFPRAEKDFALPFLIVGPVDLSPYLDQPRFAIRRNDYEIMYQEYDRWAEPLQVNFASAVSANLRSYFQTAEIAPHAPKLVLTHEQSRVLILINRMDVDAENHAVLEVQWAITVAQRKTKTMVHQGKYQTRAASNSMLDRITALNQLLTECSLAIAKSVEVEM